jgi:hypothetical protein
MIRNAASLPIVFLSAEFIKTQTDMWNPRASGKDSDTDGATKMGSTLTIELMLQLPK